MVVSFVVFFLSDAYSWAIEIPPAIFADLKSEDFHKREAAQSELVKWARGQADPAVDELLRLSKEADDPEVRERCTGVLRDLVNDEYLKDGEGYIGIRMQDELANVPGDPKPRCVIRVIQVVPDSAAQQAGLQLNDLIAGLGDQAWHDGAASLSFGEKIRQLKPSSKVTLKVMRNGGLMDVEVKLGRRPPILDQPFLDPFMDPSNVDLDAAERAAKDAYFRKWLERRKSRN